MMLFVQGICECRALQHLDVSSNQLSSACCAALGHVVAAGCHLQHLRLDNNPLSRQVKPLQTSPNSSTFSLPSLQPCYHLINATSPSACVIARLEACSAYARCCCTCCSIGRLAKAELRWQAERCLQQHTCLCLGQLLS